jgi:hypothetical protein
MSRLRSRALLAAVLLTAASARAEEVPVCFNYGCATVAKVRLGDPEFGDVKRLFAGVSSAQAEREAIARAMGSLYFHAALQTPTWRDRGGNIADEGLEGRMDCIDHSTNTTTYLALLQRTGLLRFHHVTGRVQRGRFFAVHWGASIVEKATEARWIVDTWFLDPGNPATIYPLDEWLEGARPPGTELFRF